VADCVAVQPSFALAASRALKNDPENWTRLRDVEVLWVSEPECLNPALGGKQERTCHLSPGFQAGNRFL